MKSIQIAKRNLKHSSFRDDHLFVLFQPFFFSILFSYLISLIFHQEKPSETLNLVWKKHIRNLFLNRRWNNVFHFSFMLTIEFNVTQQSPYDGLSFYSENNCFKFCSARLSWILILTQRENVSQLIWTILLLIKMKMKRESFSITNEFYWNHFSQDRWSR